MLSPDIPHDFDGLLKVLLGVNLSYDTDLVPENRGSREVLKQLRTQKMAL
jgi:hypothetical protein